MGFIKELFFRGGRKADSCIIIRTILNLQSIEKIELKCLIEFDFLSFKTRGFHNLLLLSLL